MRFLFALSKIPSSKNMRIDDRIDKLRRDIFIPWTQKYQLADSIQLHAGNFFRFAPWDFKNASEARLFFLALLLHCWQNKSFFITQSRNTGIAPHLFKEGDTVALLAGMGKLLVLREEG